MADLAVFAFDMDEFLVQLNHSTLKMKEHVIPGQPIALLIRLALDLERKELGP